MEGSPICGITIEDARMRQFDFPPEVLDQIRRDRFDHPDPLVQRRMETLWLKAHGEKHVRIAELAGLSRATVQRLLDLYKDGGLEAIPWLGAALNTTRCGRRG